VSINLRSNDLSGQIPNLGKILPLEELELRENSLKGTLPAEITNLVNMRVLSLRQNNIGGTIPNGIGLMTALEIAQLRENLFVSSIPSEVGLLTALTDLNIRDNKMTGDIPSELYGLLNLKSLNIGNTELERGNAFRGSIPTSVALMTNLGESDLVSFLVVICFRSLSPVLIFCGTEGFLLHNIQLYGTIPSVIGRLTNLSEFCDWSCVCWRFTFDYSFTCLPISQRLFGFRVML
jgi:Leucine-rich repeat (LRR) protein